LTGLVEGKMLSAVRSGALRSVLNGQGNFKVLAVASRDKSNWPDWEGKQWPPNDIPEGLSPYGHKILSREEKMATWNYVNSVYFGPDRDMKNYPTPVKGADTPPVRLGFLPASWFENLYQKTGVSGPYLTVGGFCLWMLSKEHMVIDHEFWELPISLFTLLLVSSHPKGLPKLWDWLNKQNERDKQWAYDYPLMKLRKSAESDVSKLNRLIEETETHNYIKQAKEEGVGLQLEAAYRARLHHAFTEVKKRLDYESDKAALKRQFEQDHMVNWIVDSVTKSITPQQEKESIKSCIQTLKNLSKQNVAAA